MCTVPTAPGSCGGRRSRVRTDVTLTGAEAGKEGGGLPSHVLDVDYPAKGRTAVAHTVDVADVAATETLVDDLVAEHGRIDVLVNNAGTSVRQPAGQVTPDIWDDIFATNTRGLFFLTQAVGRTMIARGGGGAVVNVGSITQAVGRTMIARGGGGAVVNVGSITQAVGRREMAAYAASKGGVAQITRVLALEWARQGVLVNCVAPGYVRTPLVASVFARPGFLEEILAHTPLGRVAEPREIAGPVLFLASDLASYVTGQTLFVDGGWTAE